MVMYIEDLSQFFAPASRNASSKYLLSLDMHFTAPDSLWGRSLWWMLARGLVSNHAALPALMQRICGLCSRPCPMRSLSQRFVQYIFASWHLAVQSRCRALLSWSRTPGRVGHCVYGIPTLTEMHVHCKEKLVLQGISCLWGDCSKALDMAWPISSAGREWLRVGWVRGII